MISQTLTNYISVSNIFYAAPGALIMCVQCYTSS